MSVPTFVTWGCTTALIESTDISTRNNIFVKLSDIQVTNTVETYSFHLATIYVVVAT